MNTKFINLQRAMKGKKLKKKTIAKELGITSTSLSQKLSGKSEFRLSEMAKIAAMLGETNITKLFFE